MIHLGQFGANGQNSPHLRSEQQSSIVQRIVQRLFPQAITHQEKPASSLIVERESKHPPQLLHALRPILFVKMNDDFGIGMRGEEMTACLEFGSQIQKVINLAVENNPDALVFVEYRLVPACQVDDA